MMNDLFWAISAVRSASIASQKTFNSGKADYVSNAIRRSAGTSSFMRFFETFASLMDSDAGSLYIAEPGQSEPKNGEKYKTVPVMPYVAKLENSSDKDRILSFLRTFSKSVSSVVFLKQPDFEEAVKCMTLDVISNPPEKTSFKRRFKVPIRMTTVTELHHGADFKSGNTAFFRRQSIIGLSGQVIQIPFVSGNSTRGTVRDLLADDFLRNIGLTPNRNNPPVALWFFHALYSGGALESKEDKAKKKGKEDVEDLLGAGGKIKSEGIRILRETFPGLSCLGCAIRDRIIAGGCKPKFGDFLPDCIELGTGTESFENFLGWEFLTRREDHEGHEDNSAMITQSEIIRAGTVFSGGIDYGTFGLPIEVSALARGLELLQENGYICACNSRGYGKVNIEIDNLPDTELYKTYLAENKDEIRQTMIKIGAFE